MMWQKLMGIGFGMVLLAVAGCGKENRENMQRGGFKRTYVPLGGKQPVLQTDDKKGPARRPRLRD